jgi:hypothetical protein
VSLADEGGLETGDPAPESDVELFEPELSTGVVSEFEGSEPSVRSGTPVSLARR